MIGWSTLLPSFTAHDFDLGLIINKGEKEFGDAVMVYSGVAEGIAKGGVAVIIAGN